MKFLLPSPETNGGSHVWGCLGGGGGISAAGAGPVSIRTVRAGRAGCAAGVGGGGGLRRSSKGGGSAGLTGLTGAGGDAGSGTSSGLSVPLLRLRVRSRLRCLLRLVEAFTFLPVDLDLDGIFILGSQFTVFVIVSTSLEIPPYRVAS